MKLLKDLKINGRVDKILNFDKADEANNTYIVKQQAGSPITLIELGMNENYVSSDNATSALTISNIKKEVNADCVTIKITLGGKLSPVLKNSPSYNSDMGIYSPQSIRRKQEELNNQIESTFKSQSSSEVYTQLATSQREIRHELEKSCEELKEGDDNNRSMAKEIDGIIKKMEQTEKELNCRIITRSTSNRQHQILESLQQHENVEMLNGIIYQADQGAKVHKLLLKRAEKPHVILEFKIDKNLQKKIIHIYVEDVIYNAIVDFGSEASQACWLNDSSDPVPINLTGAIRRASSLDSNKDSDFVQYEYDLGERIDLYRSIYYIKKELAKADYTNLKVWPDYTKDTVRFLAKVTEEDSDITNDYIQIPNTKLLNFTTRGYANSRVSFNGDDYEIKDIKEGVIPTMVMNNIILQTLTTIENKIKTSGCKSKACGLILNILMPNVYPIHIVSQKLNQLAKNIENIRNRIPHINGIELRYICESDASFLGYLTNTKKPLQEGNYIIIDAGKGTLDFSLLSLNSMTAVTNKRRGGIVGAGAAITYGVLVGLVNEYLIRYCIDYNMKTVCEKEHLIQKFICDQILGCNDIAILNTTMKNIEAYKRLYNSFYGAEHGEINLDIGRESQFEDLNLNEGPFSFNNVVKYWTKENHNLSEASAKYVTAEIDLIVQEAMTRMTASFYNEKANVVVFTGRGCLMKELRKRLKEEMIAQSILEEGQGNDLVAEEKMKTGCMHINQLLITGNYDTAVSHQSFSTLDRFQNDDENRKKKKKAAMQERQETPDSVDQLRDLIEREGIGAILKGYRSANETYGNLAHGSDLGIIKSALSLINIGGWIYYIDRRFVKKQCKLFFDGSHYIIVSSGVGSQELDQAVSEGAQVARLGFESLFPNIKIRTDEPERMVVIPKFERVTGDEVSPSQEEAEEIEKKDEKSNDDKVHTDNLQEDRYVFEDLGKRIRAIFGKKQIKKQ